VFPALADAGDGDGWLMTGHREYSAYSPLWAYWHLQAKYYDEDEGVRRLAAALWEYEQFEPSDRARDLAAEAETAATV